MALPAENAVPLPPVSAEKQAWRENGKDRKEERVVSRKDEPGAEEMRGQRAKG